MPVLYVFVDKTTGAIFRDNGTAFENEDGQTASEQYLANAMCGGEFQYAMLNAYKLLQPTYNLDIDSIFISTTDDEHRYFFWSPYSGLDHTIEADDAEIGQEDWFELVEFLDIYLD